EEVMIVGDAVDSVLRSGDGFHIRDKYYLAIRLLGGKLRYRIDDDKISEFEKKIKGKVEKKFGRERDSTYE
ncbi:unnamed protein product, partial [marine sediment metagenome]